MKNISKSKVLEIEISMPDRRDQEKFAARQKAVQLCFSPAVKQSSILEDQFVSLQSRAFSGQLR